MAYLWFLLNDSTMNWYIDKDLVHTMTIGVEIPSYDWLDKPMSAITMACLMWLMKGIQFSQIRYFWTIRILKFKLILLWICITILKQIKYPNKNNNDDLVAFVDLINGGSLQHLQIH